MGDPISDAMSGLGGMFGIGGSTGAGGLGQGLGGAGVALLGGGNVKSNYGAPQIDPTATNQALFGLYGDKANQDQAIDLTKAMATGTGPSLAEKTLVDQAANARAGTAAIASSGSGAAGQGLARRQAMMSDAASQQSIGTAAGMARAAEQVGATSALGQLGTAQRGQTMQGAMGAAGIQSGLATGQAQLQQETNQLNANAQAQNQQAGDDMMKNVMGGIEGLAMVSDPDAKTDVQPADGDSKSGDSFDDNPRTAQTLSPQDMVRQKHFGLYRPGVVQPMAAPQAPAAAPQAAPQGEKTTSFQRGLAGFGAGFSGSTPEELMKLKQTMTGAPQVGGQGAASHNPPKPNGGNPPVMGLGLSSPPQAKTDIQPADTSAAVTDQKPSADKGDPLAWERATFQAITKAGYDNPHTQKGMPEVQDPYRGMPQGLDSPEASAKFHIPYEQKTSPFTVYAHEPQLQGRPAYVLPEVEHERPSTAPPPNRTIPAGYDTVEQPTPERMRYIQQQAELSSDPQGKDSSDGGEIGQALDNLHPYSFKYKDAGNEPIPNPTGMERFFGVMTTDMKKHPTTASMVSGEGGQEKISVPAATSFALASVAHLNNRIEKLERLLGNGGHR